MQALHIHLNQQPTPMLGNGANVHGMNASIRDEHSFDSFLQKEVNEQKLKATDGPPENRSSVSDPPDSTSAPRSEMVEAKSQTEQELSTEKATQADDSSQSEEVSGSVESSKDASKKEKVQKKDTSFVALEKDGILDGEVAPEIAKEVASEVANEITEEVAPKIAKEVEKDNSDADLKVSAETVVVNTPSNEVVPSEIIGDVKNTSFVNGTALTDEQTEDDMVTPDDVILTALGAGNLNGAEQSAVKTAFAKNADQNTASKIDALESTKKSKQVLAEIPTINVQDERTVTAEGKADGKFVNSVNYDGQGSATMDLSLSPNGANLQNPVGAIINADGSVQQHTATNAQQFGTMLSAEIQSNSAELVKAGSIILKDGNQGTINLILHPEELGNVKIRLEISDNILTGTIKVESEEAYNAFKENLASLREAFAADGFETAGFDLSWSGNDQNEQEDQGKNPFGNRYDNIAIIPEDTETESDYNSYGSRAYINVMA